jgi:multidrug efflux pump
VTFFGLFLTPVFYVLLRTVALRMARPVADAVPVAPHQAELEGTVK